MQEFGQYGRELEKSVLAYWQEKQIPQKLSSQRKGAKKHVVLDGPPYVNALPHAGHVLTTTSKDIWTRLAYMRGFDAHIQPGFDCHGLPIEVMVEKELGIKSKREILEMGIEKFDAACLAKVTNNEGAWMNYYRELGAWRAYFEPYFTYKPSYIQSVWWAFKQWHDAGMITEGERSIHWCSHCETALAGYEVSDSYAQRSDPGLYVKFKVKGAENEFLLVYTTTPWTLPANVAIAVKGDAEYVKAKVGGTVLILAKALAEKVLKEKAGVDYEVVSTIRGSDLDGVEYEPLFGCASQKKIGENPKARRVYLSIQLMSRKKYNKHVKKDEAGGKDATAVLDGKKEEGELAASASAPSSEFEEFVTLSEGTGLVHCAPGHGTTDFVFGKHYGLPAASPVDERGLFTADVEQWQGQYVKKADKEISAFLDGNGSLFHQETITHSYPLCWRCKTPLLFRLSPQIYLSIDAVREKMLEANGKTHWMPPFGEDAFGNWVAGAQDWCISQQRFWGTPIPLWKCGKCGAKKVIESLAELRLSAVKDPGVLTDLHRHAIDGIELKCGECGSPMKRVPDIFNVWIDSGLAFIASHGYPFANKELAEELMPVNLVCESQDQIRGWFYALQFTSFATFGRPAFKECAVMGWVVDEKGEKMSKSLGNVVDAQKAIDTLGADALRLYYCSDVAPWNVHRFSFTNAKESQRNLNILLNTLKFYKMYAPDGFVPVEVSAKTAGLRPEDKWILSRLNTVAGQANSRLDEFEFHTAGRLLVDFVVNDFSRWYVKLARDRVAVEAEEGDRRVCLSVMRHALLQASKLLAPITPFLSEYSYGQLNGGLESVHFERYPKSIEGASDEELEEHMAIAMAASEAAASARQEAGVKLRWPLGRLVVTGDAGLSKAVEGFASLLSTQANVLQVSYSQVPPAGGKWVSREITAGEKTVTVLLDCEMTEDLRMQALLRELVRAVQESRKQNGLNVRQRIVVSVASPQSSVAEFLRKNAGLLAREVGAGSVGIVEEAKLVGAFSASASIDEKATVKARYSVSG
jgi:isoleucyl-tRNA synthetase